MMRAVRPWRSMWILGAFLAVGAVSSLEANGAYKAQTGLGCSSCHSSTNPMVLNTFGKEFKANGYKVPSTNTGNTTTEPPVVTGTEPTQSTTSPRSSLPPPDSPMPDNGPQTGDKIVMPVGGSGATMENIEFVAQAMRDCGYAPPHLQGMRTIQIAKVEGLQSILGTWSDGRIIFYAMTGTTPQIKKHTVCHEFAHHTTLVSLPDFGEELLTASGTGDSSFPSEYAASKREEKMAELVTYYRLGEDSELGFRSEFQPTEEAQKLVDETFKYNGKVVVGKPGETNTTTPTSETETETETETDPESTAATRPTT